MTAAVATRVPVQAGPPTVEQVDPRTLDRWALVVRAQAGDREAFGQLYAHYRPMLIRFTMRRTGNAELAEDITSEVFVRALRNIDRLQWQGRDFGAWLVTIARNMVMDHFKSGRYRLEVTVNEPGTLHGEHPPDLTPEGDPARAVATHLTNLTLLAAVQQLKPEQRECIRLRFLLGLSVAETAAAMGKHEGAIKAMQYRAVRSLARLLPDGFEADRC